MSLGQFTRELADDWKGLQPKRTWEAIEHALIIDTDRDSSGHVLLTFTLRASHWPDAWLARATVLDAGEEMASLADNLDRLLGA